MLKPPNLSTAPTADPSTYPDLEFHLRAALPASHTLDLPLIAYVHNRFQIDHYKLQQLILDLAHSQPELGLKASELHGVALLSLLGHKIIRLYRNRVNPAFIPELIAFLKQELSSHEFDQLLLNFLQALPTRAAQNYPAGLPAYLAAKTGAVPNQQLVAEELLVHLLALNNPAFEKYQLIFKETFHPALSSPAKFLARIQSWSHTKADFGPEHQKIIDLLLEPSQAAPHSITGQLNYIREHWAALLGSHLLDLLSGLDLFAEENRFRDGSPGESQVPNYSGELLSGEDYSLDSDWMPRVVMIARNTLVWLDQLSRKYSQPIHTLFEIPDAELELLARQGFTVLWLIGLWKRSAISKKIKHWCGNPDAESSAYSLQEYQIDPVIGGPAALENLKARTWERGIRLASDMVPNHTGLDSPWLKEHPEWYLSSEHSPFPAYRFDSGDLSADPEISLHLEDHYYDRSDAAVVFKHYDHRNDQTRYIYHGNDGTSMPWNDTAQLNYLNPELREAIIQTILDVARQFKVIRFDAAMTLAKKHIQRLWFPEPGTGGGIPSRSEYSMTDQQFKAAMPAEFWREVVDRVAAEVPDTLLLAEAFWMMEGYFVRTLGMHRVYNSAFMNMLKMEENDKFYDMLAQTLAFDPRILQRFVNFLSNPDEDTAIAQFGKGDKYFCATILMVTLPGLPMFAHSQIEGFEEKYGMEYRRAYWEETPDAELMARHEQQIFPLMKKRYLFAGADHFRLFPLLSEQGEHYTSVFAYTNQNGTERSLVLVNNSYATLAGWLKTALPVNLAPASAEPRLKSESLIQALAFDVEDSYYVIFQEQLSQLWFIRSVAELRSYGFFAQLAGYESQVYLNYQLVDDTELNPWNNIHAELHGAGIQDFAPLFRSIELAPIHGLLNSLLKLVQTNEGLPEAQVLFQKSAPLFEALLEIENINLAYEELAQIANAYGQALHQFYNNQSNLREPDCLVIAAIILLIRQLKPTLNDTQVTAVSYFELSEPLLKILGESTLSAPDKLLELIEVADGLLPLLTRDLRSFFKSLFETKAAVEYFGIHLDQNIQWFQQERMESFIQSITCLHRQQLPVKTRQQLEQALQISACQVAAFSAEL